MDAVALQSSRRPQRAAEIDGAPLAVCWEAPEAFFEKVLALSLEILRLPLLSPHPPQRRCLTTEVPVSCPSSLRFSDALLMYSSQLFLWLLAWDGGVLRLASKFLTRCKRLRLAKPKRATDTAD